MANVNKLNGFTPVQYLNGADWDGRGRWYAILAAQTNALAVGDPVKLVAGGDTAFFLPCVDLASAGATWVGVVGGLSINPRGLGPMVDPTNLNTILHRPAAAQTVNWYAFVYDDPNIVFEAQEQAAGGAGANFAATAASKNANFGINAPVTPGWLSQSFIDNGTAAAANAAFNLRLLGLKQSIDNAPGAWQRWLCIPQNHSYRTMAAGV